MKLSTRSLILYSLFAALTAVLSQISIMLPFTPVPINLAMLSVFMSGSMLGSKGGAISQLVYVLLGAIGIPVFANLSSGIGIILGPTGGYIVGYMLASLIIGLIVERMSNSIMGYILSMLIGLVSCYMLGTLWFMFVTKTDLIASLGMCVIPFIIGDLLKITAGSFLAFKLNPIVKKI